MLLENPYVPVQQYKEEFEELLRMYKELKPQTVVEIGSEYGGTLWYWLKHAPAGATVINVDPLLRDPGFSLELAWQSWCPLDVTLKTIVGYSQDKADEVGQMVDEVDFLFIDGDHTYKGAKKDWELYAPMVREGGLIAFHDLIPAMPHHGIHQLFNELKKDHEAYEYYSVNDQAMCGIGVIVK